MPVITSPSILQTKDGTGAIIVQANTAIKFVGCSVVASTLTETTVTVATGSGTWNTAGNAGAGLKLGTTDNNAWTMIANNTTWVTLAASGQFRLMGATSGYAGLKSPAVGPSVDWTLPLADGSSGQVLSTNGSGVLSFVANGSTTGTANTVSFFNGAGALSSTSTFSWDGTNLGIGVTAANSKAVIHADATITSGTVGVGAFIFGRITSNKNIGQGSAMFGSQSGGGLTNTCEGEDCIIGGRNNQINVTAAGTPQGTIVLGQNLHVNGLSFSAVFGDNSTVSGVAGVGNEGHLVCGVTNTMSIATASANNIANTLLGFQNIITDGGGILVAGNQNSVSGTFATCLGFTNLAQGYAELVIGRFNVAQGTSASWVSTDDLFVAGNGANNGSRSNAFVIAKDGKMTNTGARINKIRIVTATATLSARTDYKIVLNRATADAQNLNLPPGEEGLSFVISQTAASNAVFTLVASGGDTIDPSVTLGSSTLFITYTTGVWYKI